MGQREGQTVLYVYVPDLLHKTLLRRSRQAGRSLSEEVRRILAEAVRPGTGR